MYNACHAYHTHICWRKKKINKASFADFFSEKISKLAKKNVIFFYCSFLEARPRIYFVSLRRACGFFLKKIRKLGWFGFLKFSKL